MASNSRRSDSKAAGSKDATPKPAASKTVRSKQAAASRSTPSRTRSAAARSDANPAQKRSRHVPPDFTPSGLVQAIAHDLASSAPPDYESMVSEGGPEQKALAFAESPDLSDVVSFEGYLGATVTFPADAPKTERNQWCVLYRDWDLRNWLLIEKTGIVRILDMDDTTTTEDHHVVIWVKVDAAVGFGRGGMSVDAQFLVGEFTRAGDFEADFAGGLTPATGNFCGRSPGCCGGKTIR